LRFLVGNWTAEGGGSPGQGSGGFSFEPELQTRVLVRKSHTDYPAVKDRPAFAHDDLMIIFRDPDERAEGAVRAVYFDNEGHMIHYLVTMFGDRVIFTSDPAEHGPHFRLTYERVNGDELRVKFEIAPPGKGFATYVEGVAKRALSK
jgi:hypothetical protein